MSGNSFKNLKKSSGKEISLCQMSAIIEVDT